MVSDYNAGWGKAWEVCWKDYHKDLDEYNNTCYSIHIARKQLEKEHPDYADWMCRMADENNVCLFMGEVETEGVLELMVKTEDTHHFASVLWRPRGDEINRVDQWRDVVAKYTEGTIEF